MRKIKYSLAALSLLVSCVSANEDMGSISVESTTIDDKFEVKKTEVSNIVVIDEEKVEKINPTSVEDILNTIPGITASNVGNDRVKIHIRGVDNHRYMGEKPGVAVVIDGVPVQETTGKINLDLDNIASIKVIKGGASYLYGNDAIAGAIVITTKRPKGEDSAKIEAEAGSFGFKRFLASVNKSFEDSFLQLQGTTRDTDGYWDRAYLKHKSANGKYQYYIDDTSDITFGLDFTKRKTGDGTSVHGIDAAINDPKSFNEVSYAGFYDSELLKTFITYSKDFEDSSNLMVNISRYEDKTDSFVTPTDDDTDHTRLQEEKWVQNTLKAEYRKSYDTFAVMTGIDLARNKQDNKGTARLTYTRYGTTYNEGDVLNDSNTKEQINSVYAEIQNQITKDLTTTLNYRYDKIKYDYENHLDSSLDVDPSYNESSYRAGLNYQLNSTDNLYASFSTGFRAPTAGQVSGNQETSAEPGVTEPAPNLKPEITLNYEIGIRGNIFDLDYDAAIFQIDRKDYLGQRAGSYIWGTDEEEDSYTDNLGDIRSRGFELSLNSDKTKSISYDVAYTYLDATFEKYDLVQVTGGGWGGATYGTFDLSGNQVPRTPKHTLNFTVDYKPSDKLTISPELIAKSSYYADEMNKFKQPGYAVVNLRSTYKVDNSLEFFAKIDNVFSKNYYQFVNVSSSSYDKDMTDATIRVAAPRAYYIGLRYKF